MYSLLCMGVRVISAAPFFYGGNMACFDPIFAFQPWASNSEGKRPLKFASDIQMKDVPNGLKMAVPCGRCIGCRLDRSRQWAVRCVHEASLYESNCFITLTFNDEYLYDWFGRNLNVEDIQPCISGSLVKRDFQLFMKRLRRAYPHIKIKFFHCGEYGGLNGRPHHHACLFNFDFPDRKAFITETGSKVFVSKKLEELWPYGYSYIGDVTFESAAYVARYVLKKWARANLKGKALYDAMIEFDKNDGDKITEYITMSRNKGIGEEWISKYGGDVYPKDYLTIRGVKCKPPKYYDLKKALTNDDLMFNIKFNRLQRAKGSTDNSLIRLKVRKIVKEKEAKQMERKYETGCV